MGLFGCGDCKKWLAFIAKAEREGDTKTVEQLRKDYAQHLQDKHYAVPRGQEKKVGHIGGHGGRR